MSGYNKEQNYNNGKQKKRREQKKFNSQSLPQNYLVGGYYHDDEKKKLKKEYIIDYSKNIAESLDREGGRERNKRSQIRKFYDCLLRTEQKLYLNQNDFLSIEADLATIQLHAFNAKTREVVSEIFLSFIEENIAAIHDERDLRAFVKHFEAVIIFIKRD